MESPPQNPEFRITPENFHPCITNVIPISEKKNVMIHSDQSVHNLLIGSDLIRLTCISLSDLIIQHMTYK